MPVHIELSLLLRRYVPGYDEQKGILLANGEGKTIQQLIEELGIPPERVYTIMTNHYPGERDYVAKDGDHILLAMIIGAG